MSAPIHRAARSSHRLKRGGWSGWLVALISVAIMLCGAVNLFAGLRLTLPNLGSLSTLDDPVGALGATGEVILGVLLELIGIGLWWRLRAVWVFALLILSFTLAANGILHHWSAQLILPVSTLAGLFLTRRTFSRTVPYANTLISLVCVLGTLAYGMTGSYILGKGFQPHILNLTTAWYFTVVSLSTVGYGDIVPVSDEARIFVMTLLVVGIGVFATALAATLGPMVSGELSRLFDTRKDKVNLSGHIILIGDGILARATALELASRKAVFIQVLNQTAEPVIPGKAVERIETDEESALRKAGVERAETVIAAYDDDGRNAFSTLLVKNINPKIRVVAIASSRGSIRPLELAAADVVFAPLVAGGRLLADLAQEVDIPQQFKDLLQRS